MMTAGAARMLVTLPCQLKPGCQCRAALEPPSYVDSSEMVEGADLSKNGLRIRIKTYFNRQRVETHASSLPGPSTRA